MDDVRIIALAIPVFFALIAIEWFFTRTRSYYRLSDVLNDLSCGMLQQVFTVFAKTAIFAGYIWIYSSIRVLELPLAEAWVWVVCFIGVDFFYYWFHRLSHEINALWAAHVVHHQSEDYNLAVALRQSVIQGIFSSFFYWPLALLGFHPAMFLTLSAANTLYQFWIHTQAIDRLGPLEWVFNTPSHHRVHHGRNPLYIDRNHGGTLIVWDRLFGTFQAETEKVYFGITKPLESWNPLWANLHYWRDLWVSARQTPRFSDKLRVFLKEPGWFPGDQGGFQAPPPVDGNQEKFDCPIPTTVKSYAVVQFTLAVVVTFVFLFVYSDLSQIYQLAVAIWISLALLNLGALLENRAWGLQSEMLRHLYALTVIWAFTGTHFRVHQMLGSLAILFLVIWTVVLVRGARRSMPETA